MKLMVCLLGLSFSTFVSAKEVNFNKNAPQGGTFVTNNMTEPETLHPIKATDVAAADVHKFILDQLASRNPNTLEMEPHIAESWEISKDNRVFTFTIRKDAFFHDGKPVTPEDVKFSYDMIFEPKYKAVHLQPYFESVQKVEIIEGNKVRFTCKDDYFLNFLNIASQLNVVPKHIYADIEKSDRMNKDVIGSGPYKLFKYDQGQKITLKKFDKWYGNNVPTLKGQYNFETLVMRFVKEEAVYLELLKKGEFDSHLLNAEQFKMRTEGGAWGKKIFKVQTLNKSAKGYSFIGWNLENPILKDKNVRIALSHLINREEANKKFRFGMNALTAGPASPDSPMASSKVKPIVFDPKKAQKILSDAGWSDSDKNGVLDKIIDGKRTELSFTVLNPNKDTEKFLTLYQQDMKKAGVDMKIQLLEWNSFLKALDKGTFEGAFLSWSGTLDPDPKQIWHSTSAVEGGSNFVKYKNPEVDKLIDQGRTEKDRTKRNKLFQKVYELIAEDQPYSFMFSPKYTFYSYSDRVVRPGDTMVYSIVEEAWWTKAAP